MSRTNVIALFCEDIREEKRDTVSLIGLLPDNINIALGPNDNPGENVAALPKLCIYIRINFHLDDDIGRPSIKLTMPDGEAVDLGTIEKEVIDRARNQARERGNSISGVISRVVLSPVRFPSLGLLKAEVLLNDEWHLGGILHLKPAPQTSDITASTA